MKEPPLDNLATTHEFSQNRGFKIPVEWLKLRAVEEFLFPVCLRQLTADHLAPPGSLYPSSAPSSPAKRARGNPGFSNSKQFINEAGSGHGAHDINTDQHGQFEQLSVGDHIVDKGKRDAVSQQNPESDPVSKQHYGLCLVVLA